MHWPLITSLSYCISQSSLPSISSHLIMSSQALFKVQLGLPINTLVSRLFFPLEKEGH